MLKLSLFFALLTVLVLVYADDTAVAAPSDGGFLGMIASPFVNIGTTVVSAVQSSVNGFVAFISAVGQGLYVALMATVMAIPNLIMSIVNMFSGGAGAAPPATT